MNNISIRSKTLLVSLIPLTLTALLLSSVYIWNRVRDIDTSLNKTLNDAASYLARTVEFDVIAKNIQSLDKSIAVYGNEKSIIRIQILDKHNKLISEWSRQSDKNTTDPTVTYQDDNITVIKKPIHTITLVISDFEQGAIKNQEPTTSPSGYVVLTGTSEFANDVKVQSILQGAMLTLFSLFATTLFAYYYSNTLSGPLNDIASAVRKLATGELNTRITSIASGEIGQVQLHLNNMANSLDRARNIERHQAENLLYIEKSKAMTTLESLGEGVITTDQIGTVTYLNPAAASLTGFNAEEAVGNHLTTIFRTINASTRQPFDYPIQSCIDFGTVIRHDALLRLIRHDGDEIVIRDTSTAIRDKTENAIGAVLIFDDFTSMHAMAERLVYQAAHDDLTGLHNRREFENQLETALHEVHGHNSEHVLCYIDLDQFKIINDTCGHAAGDELLRQLSQLIKSKVRSGDVLSRLGGDEFGIILKNCSFDKAFSLAQNILDALSNFAFTCNNRKYQVGASIGLVALDNTQLSLTDALIAADSACYIAKEQGRNRIHVFTADNAEIFKRHGEMQWFQRIKESLSHNSFELLAQRIVSMTNKNQDKAHYEVLLRLRDNGQLYSPEVFLTTAERYNLMPEIDRWVITNTFNALREASIRKRWRNESPLFGINLSGQSLGNEEFQAFVYDMLIKSGINPKTIVFEITETAAISNLSRAIAFMKVFREIGCQFALDDFGSGLSSFGYLTSLPVDFIKIDGKLISNIKNNPINLSIVDAINRIAHQMHLETIAEFVEDKLILERIRPLNIDYVQGFALSPLESLTAILSANE